MPAHGEMKDKTKTNKKGRKKKKKKKDRKRKKKRKKCSACWLQKQVMQFVCSFVYGYEDGE